MFCPHCQARDWREYLLLRCQHCHAVFASEQIRYEIGSLQYGDGALCPPYELFPLCPYCGKAEWCPAEEVRLWNVRDRAARIAKWRRRFGLEGQVLVHNTTMFTTRPGDPSCPLAA